MPAKKAPEGHRGSPKAANSIQDGFRRVFHLRTLYDVSKELFGSTEFETVLKNFLLMTMGNFGVSDGFLLTRDDPSKEITHYVSMGFQDQNHDSFKNDVLTFLHNNPLLTSVLNSEVHLQPRDLPDTVGCVVPFRVDAGCSGLLGLGLKLTEEPFNDDDKEVLLILVNNLVIALNNARTFENIKSLNQELQKKNVQLEAVLSEVDRRVFHLKTLYDISKDIFATIDFEAVLRNFLLMTLGQMAVGLLGMRRRIADYDVALNFERTHLIVTIAGIAIAIAVIISLINFIVSAKKGKAAGNNPWNSRSPEFQISSPPPLHNYDTPIEVVGEPYGYGSGEEHYVQIRTEEGAH